MLREQLYACCHCVISLALLGVYGRVCSQAQSCVVRIHSTTMGMYWEVLLPLD